MQGIGVSSSQVAGAARARAAEQMAYEDAWKASNPDFKTPFASVEDAVSRLLPYHVFAEYDEDDVCDSNATEKSSAQKWHDEMEDTTLEMIAEFEKQVLTFNVMARWRAEGQRAEERLMLEQALLLDERRMSDYVRAVIQLEQQQEVARAHQALAQAQAASAWPLVQAQPTPWQQALAAAAMARGEVIPGQMATPGAAMHPQQDPAAAGAWQMMHQQQMGLSVWPTFVAPRGEGSSSGQAGAPGVLQEHSGGGQTTSAAAAAAAGMAQPWWGSGAQRRE